MRTRLIFLLVVLVAVSGIFLWSRSRNAPQEGGTQTSPVLVDILSPGNGSTATQGEILTVLAQAWSPSPLDVVEFWVDNELLAQQSAAGETAPAHFSQEWEPGNPGVHALFVKVRDAEGEVGQSQTLLINVNPQGLTQVLAADGQTLEDISAEKGVPLDEMASLNPGLEPQQPLGDGQPVILPPAPDEENLPPPPGDPGGPDLVIHWQFTPLTQVDQSYCYQSTNGESWQRVPDASFSFLPGQEWLQTPLFNPAQQQLNLFLECWGWDGGTLKYLGEGQTSLDFTQIPGELIILGEGFQVNGMPEMKPLSGDIPDEELQVPAPFALREAQTVAECASHYGGNFWASVICDELMNAQVKQFQIFVWEWQPEFCWPGSPCPWADEIDGYWLYELDFSLQSGYIIKDIPNGNQKVSAVALPWGAKCYGVRAYVETLTAGIVVSEMDTYCGEQPQPQEQLLSPQDWLTTDGEWIKVDCEDYGDAPYVSPTGTQIAAGVYIINKDDCFRQGDASAAVKFTMPVLLEGSVIQQVNLLLSHTGIVYGVDTEVATNEKPFCLSRLGKAKQDWTSLSDGHFISSKDILWSQAYYSHYSSGFGFQGGKRSADVTGMVLGWMKNPSTNHGLIIMPDWGDLYNRHILESGWDQGWCYSVLDGVQLQVLYFTPPN